MKIDTDITDEKLLIEQLIGGDKQAFRCIYDKYGGALLRRLIRLTKIRDVAEDILQETFVKLWEKRDTIDANLPIKPWLYKVAENLVFQFYRELARDARVQKQVIAWFVEEEVIAFDEDTLSEERDALLQDAINQLPPMRKQVFELCKIQGLSYEQAANQLGISTSTVSNHLLKANANIRVYLMRNKDSLFVLIPVFLARTDIDTSLIINSIEVLA